MLQRKCQYTAAGGEVQYLRVVFTNDRRRSEKVDTRIGKANELRREFFRSVVIQREILNTEEPLVFTFFFNLN